MEQSKGCSYTVLKRKQKRGTTPATDKSMFQSRYVQQITEFNPPPLCISHSQEIGHMCFTCDSKCLCSQCFNDGQHKTHDVKTLDRSYSVVQANLNECLIRIKSKSDLLSLLHESISTAQSELVQDFEVYKEHIENSFDRVLKYMEQKKENMIESITRYHEEHIGKTKTIMTQVRQAIKDSMSVYKLIDKNLKELPNFILCFFYSDKKKSIEELISQENITWFKQAVPVVKWNLEVQAFEEMLSKIQLLDLSTSSAHGLGDKNEGNKISKKKLRKISKLPIFEKNRRPRDSHPVSPKTPKQKSREKDNDRTAKQSCKRMRSPVCDMLKRKASGKMLSMPASPFKDKKQVSSPPVIIDHQRKHAKKKA